MSTAAPTTRPTPTAATATAKDRINVLKFNVAGYIPVNAKQASTITKAIDAFNATIADLKKAGATITKDEEPQFTPVSAASGEE